MLERATAFFGPEYPRDREDRLDAAYDAHGEKWRGPFYKEGAAISDLLGSKNGGFKAAADRFADPAA